MNLPRFPSFSFPNPDLYGAFYCMLNAIACRFTLKLVRDMIITYSQMHHTDTYSQHNSIIWPVLLNGWMLVYKLGWLWVQIKLLSLNFQIWRLLVARNSLTFRQTIECKFPLKLVREMIISCSQMHSTDRYSQHNSIIWPVWLNGWAFVYELSGLEFKSRCCNLNFRYSSCFKQ